MPRGDNFRGPGNGRFERTLTSQQRDAEAGRLRADGWTYRQIAEHLGFRDHSQAHKAVERIMAETIAEPAEAVRRLELARLDDALRVAVEVMRTQHLLVSQGKVVRVRRKGDDGRWVWVPLLDDAPRLQAIDRIIKIMERRAKLLGLDAPTQIQVLTMDVIDAEIARLSAELGLTPGTAAAGEAPPAP